jgi:hypothetical protein
MNKNKTLGFYRPGLPDFSKYQNGEKSQMTTKSPSDLNYTTGAIIYSYGIKYFNIFCSKAILNTPKFDFLV